MTLGIAYKAGQTGGLEGFSSRTEDRPAYWTLEQRAVGEEIG